MKEKETTRRNLLYYLNKNRFFDLLFDTKKYFDFFWSKEASFSFILSIMFTVLSFSILIKDFNAPNLLQLSNLKIGDSLSVYRNLILVVCGGFFTVLGLSLAGLALVTGSIQDDFIKKVEDKNSFDILISILFNFYFAGAIICLSIFILLGTYFITFMSLSLNIIFLFICLFVNFYFVIFSLIYSTMLLGTCIRMLLTKYYIINHDANK